MSRAPRTADRVATRRHAELWLLTVVFFGIGDVATTGIGIGFLGATEANPFLAVFVEGSGLFALGMVKVGILVGAFAVWRGLPRPHNLGIPLALASLGLFVTAWNVLVLALAA